MILRIRLYRFQVYVLKMQDLCIASLAHHPKSIISCHHKFDFSYPVLPPHPPPLWWPPSHCLCLRVFVCFFCLFIYCFQLHEGLVFLKLRAPTSQRKNWLGTYEITTIRSTKVRENIDSVKPRKIYYNLYKMLLWLFPGGLQESSHVEFLCCLIHFIFFKFLALS